MRARAVSRCLSAWPAMRRSPPAPRSPWRRWSARAGGRGGDQDETPYPNAAGGFSPIGDSLDASSTIAKLRYSIYNRAGFIGVSMRDQAVYRDVSSTMSSVETQPDGPPLYANFSGSSTLSHIAAYDLDAQVPMALPHPRR